MIQGRTFTASLKPAWSEEKILKFCQDMSGTATVFAINHDKDTNDNGELVEVHTHVYLEYETPRKITTIANLLEVENNFVEIVKSKKAFMRYLTHKDDLDKFQYDDDYVYTNSAVPYSDVVLGGLMSDKEIAQYIIEGRGIELLGIVPSTKLRTIQAFLQYDKTGQMHQEIRSMSMKLESMERSFEKIEMQVTTFFDRLANGIDTSVQAMKDIASEIAKARLISQSRSSKRM